MHSKILGRLVFSTYLDSNNRAESKVGHLVGLGQILRIERHHFWGHSCVVRGKCSQTYSNDHWKIFTDYEHQHKFRLYLNRRSYFRSNMNVSKGDHCETHCGCDWGNLTRPCILFYILGDVLTIRKISRFYHKRNATFTYLP